MSKEPNGLFSRMVKFVRNPATNWAELDQSETGKDSSYSKANLKEMIERKRRNDFVRKREFDMLRKIRQREALGGPADASARPSFFQSSMPSKPDDRAQTLKKIDEIEAQMSMQWWKTNVPNSALQAISSVPNNPVGLPNATAVRIPDPTAAAGTVGGKFAYSPTSPLPLEADSVDSTAFSAPAAPLLPPNLVVAPPPAARAGVQPPRGAMLEFEPTASGSAGFSASKLFAMDVEEVQHDAEHEEAAIRFANGDDSAAEAALLEALSPNGTHAGHDETWLTLFDFYRATGNHDSFELHGIDYANQFGRSAPGWFSMPDLVAKLHQKDATPASQASASAHWTAPSSVGIQSVATLKATLARVPQPWRVDWSKLKSIDPAAYDPLASVFAAWATQPIRIEFLGTRQLDAFTIASTPSNDRNVPQNAWKLRMEVLRATHRADDFELTALDYCVTYEVSPPSWDGVKCSFKMLDADTSLGESTIIGDAFRDSMASTFDSRFADSNVGAASSLMHQTTVIELSGKILGDATQPLEKLEVKMAGADVMTISCAKLIRVDFSAAGTLLNWVSARQAEGRIVQFTDVHRLVASFFHVIGISEHARVSVRRG